jgi:hypothetical protein
MTDDPAFASGYDAGIMINWRGAFIGLVVGGAVAGIAGLAHGWFIGMANDYSLYRRYDPATSFLRKLAVFAPIAML